MLGKDKLDKLEFCDHCILGKQHKVKFGSGMHYSSKPFEYVHWNIWGPSKTITHGGTIPISYLSLMIILGGYEYLFWKTKVTSLNEENLRVKTRRKTIIPNWRGAIQ